MNHFNSFIRVIGDKEWTPVEIMNLVCQGYKKALYFEYVIDDSARLIDRCVSTGKNLQLKLVHESGHVDRIDASISENQFQRSPGGLFLGRASGVRVDNFKNFSFLGS